MERPKILYLGNLLSRHGFTPTSVETLGERLKMDFEIIQGSSKKNKLVRLLHMLFLVVRWRKVDYLIIDTYSTSAFVFAWMTAKMAFILKVPYIPILHGGDLPGRVETSPKKLSKFLAHAYKVVCPSSYLKTKMGELIKRDYDVIPNFIDIEEYSYTEKHVSQASPIKLFWLRSFHKIYNPQLAVKVLKELKDRGHDARLCMVGPDKDGSLANVKKLARQLNVEGNLKITGRLSKADWTKLSRDYNIFINTTNIDNTPVSLMEAMALGFPVVTTNVGGISYLLEEGENAMTILPDRVDLFVEAIEALLANERISVEMGLAARKKAESWDWGIVRAKWSALLR